MAILVDATDPVVLVKAIKKAIDDGKIETWSYDDDGDFFHTPDQWKGQGWLRPSISPQFLVFGLVGVNEVEMTKTVYGVLHGRFIEMLVTHFDEDFGSAIAFAKKQKPDHFK